MFCGSILVIICNITSYVISTGILIRVAAYFPASALSLMSQSGTRSPARVPIRNRLLSDSCVDIRAPSTNNPRMPRPDAVRRVKSYSAANGYVYQYYFFEGDRAQRNGSPGGEFTYAISVDRKSAFRFKIFVHQSALEAWAKQNGRHLSSSEEYAVAKMRLFQACDEGSVQVPAEGQQGGEVAVDESNLEALLEQLGI